MSYNFRITTHARDRFVQRSRLRFHLSAKFPDIAAYFINDGLTDSLMFTLLKNASRIVWWECVPFYKNKIESQHGPTVAFKAKDKKLTFVCTPTYNGVMVVRTVVKDFDPRFTSKYEK